MSQIPAAHGAELPPHFTANGLTAKMLVPGAAVSLYGTNLGPDCDTQVTIDNKQARILYVSKTQINFVVPKDLPEHNGALLRVICGGQSSEPVLMPAGLERTTVELDRPAYADMPVWLRVSLPAEGGAVAWPQFFDPAGFSCNQVEARKDGVLLPLLTGSRWLREGAIVFSGNVCGTSWQGNTGRLPIHLLYRFSEPGIYEVRFTEWRGQGSSREIAPPRFQSEWTAIRILPPRPGLRQEWLQLIRSHPPTGAEQIITETFPSLFGLPDEESLDILTRYLNHPDGNVRKYARRGLYYWPDAVLRAHSLI